MDLSLPLWIAAALAFAFAFILVVRRLPPALGMVGFLMVVPLGLAARSTGADRASLFSLVKLGLVGFGAAYVQALKITRWADRSLGRKVAFALLAGNILEAVSSTAATAMGPSACSPPWPSST